MRLDRILVLILALLLSFCGKPGKDGEPGEKGEPGDDGTNGNDGNNGNNGNDGADYTPPAKVSLEGYYFLPNGGYLELVEDSEARIIVQGTQRVYTVNADHSLALQGNIPTGPNFVRNDEIRLEYTITYAAGNGMSPDAGGAVITGARKTVTTLSKTGGALKINTTVYSASGLVVEVNRDVVSE